MGHHTIERERQSNTAQEFPSAVHSVSSRLYAFVSGGYTNQLYVLVAFLTLREKLCDQFGTAFDGAFLCFVVHMHHTETPFITERPLEVVHQRPDEIPANIDSFL